VSESGGSKKSAAERSVAAQQRYVVPVLLVVAVIVVAMVWAVGGIQWWIAVPVLALGLLAVVRMIRTRRR
jgi:membrane protein YdbS with pleckstrin-like domain